MTQTISSVSAVARASIQHQLLDAQMTTKHLSLASFAHELELVQERFEFGLATRRDVTQVEDRLVVAWRDLIDATLLDAGELSNMEDSNGSHH
jgi:outer membrane protein TolC